MRINNNFVLQEIADDYIVVPVGEEASRLQGIIKLNTTGAFLWNLLCHKDCSELELVEALKVNYHVDKDIAEADINRFIQIISNMGCIDQ